MDGAKLSLAQNTLTINLSTLKDASIAANKKTPTKTGGAAIHESITMADAASVVLQIGNCNSFGVADVPLRVGYGNTLGLFGFSVDNIL